MMTSDIDIVYTWVDGSDPELNRRRALYASNDKENVKGDDKGGDTRYSNLGELAWSVASVNRFMPWVRRIYIVTDGQDPSRELELTLRNFPSPIPVEVVDHKVIFRGYEAFLPVFNCNSIETMLWRIPGLSEKYMYFNDDTFVMAPMQPEEWFDRGKMVLHGHRMNRYWAQLLDNLRFKNGKRILGFKTPMLMSAKIAESHHILYYYHTPTAQLRHLFEDFYECHRCYISCNIYPKFRDRYHFSPHSLCNLLAEQAGILRLERSNINLFLKPTAKRPDYLTKRLARADRDPNLKLGCISSLDKASDAQREEFTQWIMRRLQLKPVEE